MNKGVYNVLRMVSGRKRLSLHAKNIVTELNFIDFIVEYLDNLEFYIFIVREQHVLYLVLSALC